MTNTLRRNANLVEMLGGALRDGDHALGSAPSLLKQILEEQSWREFVTQRGEHVHHERFADFVRTSPLAGLGSDMELVRRIVADDTTALNLLDVAVLNAQGRPENRSIRTDKSEVGGTTRAAAIRRLRKDRPDLHAEVLAGRLTAHAAAVAAGFRPRTFTVRPDPESAARTLRKHMTPGDLASLAKLLAEAGEDA